ncbi:hypothetical protein EXE59_02115 [Nocardioides eburneiflavus]|uniref:Uncharacterized protein n=1 Tax=Nocardioides eburneiflavus TaxID=2518372 RepID=A0A4Z1C2A3_9ACTN|nr:hypothetical protein [Nocardioides eburneiflavus]TGN62872.1 hypothetical protein EXE59_02115 [Nocardioides eburneiflavus]
MSDRDVQDRIVLQAFDELRQSPTFSPDPVPSVRRSVSTRRRTRRLAAGATVLAAASAAFAVAGPFALRGDVPVPVATQPPSPASPVDTSVELSHPGAPSALISDVSATCESSKSQGRAIALLVVQSHGADDAVLRLQGDATGLVGGTRLALPLDDTGSSAGEPPALFELFAALPRATAGPVEASSTSPASRGTVEVVTASCVVGEPVELKFDVWLGAESGGERIHVEGRAVGSVTQ